MSELEAWRSHILLHGPDKVKSFLAESTEYESTLWEERERFESETVEPIWCLRVDLQHWTEGVREGGRGLRPEEQREVLEQLEMVKGQQVRIQEILQSEFDLLSADLKQANERYVATLATPTGLTHFSVVFEYVQGTCLSVNLRLLGACLLRS